MATPSAMLRRHGDPTAASGSIGGDFWFAVRVLAGCFGLSVAGSVVAFLHNPSFDPNIWWLDLRWLPIWARPLLPSWVAIALIAFAVRPEMEAPRRISSVTGVALAATIALVDTARYYALWFDAAFEARSPIPASLVVCSVLVLFAVALRRPRPLPASSRIVLTTAVLLTFVVGVPMLHILAFGTSDYRRRADAIVVFGAKVRPDGSASIVLAERVTRASELYREGAADLMVMTGGIEPTGADETVVMRDLAVSQGVPLDAIVLDREGVNTRASVESTSEIIHRRGLRSLLAVSQPYHLPRIKLAYARAGLDVWTVPAEMTLVPRTGLIVAREIPAFWLYYVRAAIA